MLALWYQHMVEKYYCLTKLIIVSSLYKHSRRAIMRIQIQKWGNSLAIRIPKSFAKETNIEQGSIIDLSTIKGQLIAKPIKEDEYSLDELLAGVTKENLHTEFDIGDAVGRETI